MSRPVPQARSPRQVLWRRVEAVGSMLVVAIADAELIRVEVGEWSWESRWSWTLLNVAPDAYGYDVAQ